MRSMQVGRIPPGKRRTAAAVVGALALAAAGAGVDRAGAAAAPPPTEADFVGYPSCLLYLIGADTRLRIRAAHVRTICRRVGTELSGGGARWSLHPRPARRILSPICRMADPRAVFELDVVDDARGGGLGPRICASLARAGWFDLTPP